ncbi:Oxysterol-binding protein [Fistulina hepatica ATCC 64428]|uniref:Oxysterol-binding protein n=1 Tax=Fistulina hepatica ATCC 64428 TaxID=1128425 RepID=A0A0D7AF69_9AGAR|nr:Oxysterol-binding protein [Fistulina hepatica ATCC 64428]
MSETVGDAVPPAQRSSWISFLKSIASFSGDLSSMTAPPFILSPVSLTEFPAYWCEHPELFSAISDAPDSERRAIAVLKWFISTLRAQYTSRTETMGSEKKPLNPVLGELFYGHWPDENGRGRLDLLVEQVSHHPPVTAYCMENRSKGLLFCGHNGQKTSFSGGSIIVKQVGHAVLKVKLADGNTEDFLITFPRLRIDGLWYGSPYIELVDTSYIISSTGSVCTIDYKGKGYFSGKSHSFKANLSVSAPMHATYAVEGLWHMQSKVAASSGSALAKGDPFFDATAPQEDVTAVGGEDNGEMGEFETRRLWEKVAKGIREGDFEMASREKTKIENEQRQRRRDEAAAGTKWPLKHFEYMPSDETYEWLGAVVRITPSTEEGYRFVGNWPASMTKD